MLGSPDVAALMGVSQARVSQLAKSRSVAYGARHAAAVCGPAGWNLSVVAGFGENAVELNP